MSARSSETVERTCVGCRSRAPKVSLIRIVRSPTGGVTVDPSGHAPGRGCYVHPEETCLSLSERRGAVPRALRTVVPREELANLRTMIERLMYR
ncbi:MAG: YlxR family protein [Actinomycetota bacterium]